MIFFFPFGILWTFLFLFFGIRIISSLFRDHPRRHWDDIFGERSSRRVRENPFQDILGSRYRLQDTDDAEHQIFRLADKLKGRLTVSDVVVHTGLGIHEAEEAMNQIVDGYRVKMEVDDRGIVLYEFPEIIARHEGGNF